MFFGEGQWHPNPEMAEPFDSLAAAIQVAVKYQLQGAEVVLQIGDQPNESYDVHLDLLGGGKSRITLPGDQPRKRA